MLHLHCSSEAEWVTPYEWSEEVNHAGEISLPAASASLCALQPVIDWLLTARRRWEVWLGWQAWGSCCNKSRASLRVVRYACGLEKQPPRVCQQSEFSPSAWFADRRWWEFCVWGFFYVIKMWEDRNCCYKVNRSPAVRSQTLPENKRAHQQTWHALKEQEIGGFLTSLYSV